VVSPVVIEALKIPRIAMRVTAHHGATMPAGVVKHADSAVGTAHEEKRPSADAAGEEIALVRQLGFMGGIEPREIEDPPLFALEEVGIAVDARTKAKNASGLVFLEQGVHAVCPTIHGSSRCRCLGHMRKT